MEAGALLEPPELEEPEELEPPLEDSSQRHRTMQVASASSLPRVAVMVAVPGPTAVTVPFPSTVATFSSLELKKTSTPSGWAVYRSWKVAPAFFRVASVLFREMLAP